MCKLSMDVSMDVTGVTIPEDQRLIFFKSVRGNAKGQISALDKDININEDLKMTPITRDRLPFAPTIDYAKSIYIWLNACALIHFLTVYSLSGCRYMQEFIDYA
jgi:hypothetical protein